MTDTLPSTPARDVLWQAEQAAMRARHGPRYRLLAVLTVMLGAVAGVMEATIVNVALPQIIEVFGVGQDHVQLLATGFLAATIASMLLSYWAVMRFGVRTTYVATLVLLMLSCGFAALTRDFAVLAFLRVLQGVAAGILQPLSMFVIVSLFAAHERGRAMTAYGLGIVLAPAVGPAAGGLLVDTFGWPSVFLVTLPLCLVSLMLVPRYLIRGLPDPRVTRPTLDVVGLVLISLALVAVLGGLSLLFVHPAGAAMAVVGGLVLSVVFVWWQGRARYPLVQLHVLAHGRFAASALVALAYGMGIYGSTYLVPQFAQTGAGYSAFDAGTMLLPGGLVMAATLMVAGPLADRLPPYRVALAGLICFVVSSLLLGLLPATLGFWWLALWVALGRAGLGMVIPGLNASALALAPPGQEVAASMFMNFFRQLGGAVGVTLLAVALEARARHLDMPVNAPVLQEGFVLIALVYALACWPASRMRSEA